MLRSVFLACMSNIFYDLLLFIECIPDGFYRV